MKEINFYVTNFVLEIRDFISLRISVLIAVGRIVIGRAMYVSLLLLIAPSSECNNNYKTLVDRKVTLRCPL